MLKKNLNIFFSNIALYLIPVFAWAAPQLNNFKDLIDFFSSLVLKVIPVIAALVLLAFFWGISKFVLSVGGGKEKEEAKEIILWGIIALFVMVSVWGIVRLLQISVFQNTLVSTYASERLVLLD